MKPITRQQKLFIEIIFRTIKHISLLFSLVKSSQVTFIYIALLTIQIVTKQLHNIKMGK